MAMTGLDGISKNRKWKVKNIKWGSAELSHFIAVEIENVKIYFLLALCVPVCRQAGLWDFLQQHSSSK